MQGGLSNVVKLVAWALALVGSGFTVQGLAVRLWFRVQGLGFEVWGLGFGFLGFGFRALGVSWGEGRGGQHAKPKHRTLHCTRHGQAGKAWSLGFRV